MLLGSILFIAQLGAWQIRSLLTEGKTDSLKQIRPDAVGSATHFSQALGQAPIMDVINYVNKEKGEKIAKILLQHADDLDYLQDLINSICKKGSLNPSLNAVIQAFSRRRFKGLFKSEGQSVELDTLLYQGTKSEKDDEAPVVQKTKTPNSSPRLCYRFQYDACT